MSIKIDDVRDAFTQAVKSMSEQATAKTGLDPLTILKIIGGILGAIVVGVWIAIILNKHRQRRAELLSKPKPRHARTQRNRH